MQPLISVLIPVYNVEAYLSECLDSVLAQSYSNWECICVDDDSSDKSMEVMKRYAERDSRIVALSQKNKGSAGARNAALRAMKGDYFTFLDSDDVLTPHALKTMYDLAQEHKASIVEASHYLFTHENERYWPKGHEEWCILENRVYPAGSPPSLREARPFPCMKLISREFFSEYGIFFDENLRFSEDALYVSSLVLHCACYVTSSEIIYGYRQDRGNSQSNSTKHEMQFYYESQALEKAYKNWRAEGRHHEVAKDLLTLLQASFNNHIAGHTRWRAVGATLRMVPLMFMMLRGAGRLSEMRYCTNLFKGVTKKTFDSFIMTKPQG